MKFVCQVGCKQQKKLSCNRLKAQLLLLCIEWSQLRWFWYLLTSSRWGVQGTYTKSRSIHPFSIPAIPADLRAWGGVHPGQIASPSQGHTETNNHARSHSLLRTILESPIKLTCMFLDGGRKPEYPNMQTPHRKAPVGDRTWNPFGVRWRC